MRWKYSLDCAEALFQQKTTTTTTTTTTTALRDPKRKSRGKKITPEVYAHVKVTTTTDSTN